MTKCFSTKKGAFVLLLFLVSQVFVCTSCTSSGTGSGDVSTSMPPDRTKQTHKDYSRDSFHYDYGDSWGTYGEYWIWMENGTAYFEGSARGIDTFVDAFAEVDASIFDVVAQVIHDNRIHLWDGFAKTNSSVLDGSGFSLDMKYGIESIRAHGYTFEPKNYKEGHAALVDFLSAYAENLPATTPSADTVGYIFAYTEEFRFDLMLAMYDGMYARVETVRIAKKSDEDNFYTFRPSMGIEMPVGEREQYVELDFEPARQLREQVLQLKLSNGLPHRDVSVPYAAVSYFGNKIRASHFCHATLSPEDQRWFIEKILAVIGLPEGFDLNTLF